MSLPPFTFTPGRHPAEYCAFGIGAVGGTAGVLSPMARSSSLDQAYAPWVVVAFYAFIAFWGVFGILVLALVRDQEDRRRMEEIALYGYGYPCLLYAITALWIVGGKGLTAALGYAFIPTFATWRIVQMHVESRRWREAQEAGRDADPPPLGIADRPTR